MLAGIRELGLLTMDGEGQSGLFDDVRILLRPNRSMGEDVWLDK
jgi:hypothetical protein